MKIIRARLLFPALTALLIASQAMAHVLFLRGDLNIERKDVAAHLKLHTKYHLQMRDMVRNSTSPGGLVRDSIALFHQRSMPEEHIWIWPRLIYVVTAPMTLLFGLTPRVIILSNLIWLSVLLLSIYCIGNRFLNPEAGFLSALAVSLFPVTYGMARGYGLDFPLMAAIAVNIYWLMRTDFFTRTLPSAILGCMMGLGLLVKMQLVIFLCGPVTYALLVGARDAYRGRRDAGRGRAHSLSLPGRFIMNVSVVAALGMILSSLFWWGNLRDIVDVFVKHAARVSEFGNVDLDREYLGSFSLSPQYFCYYLVPAIIYVSPVFFAAAVLALPCFLRSGFRGKAFILLWIAVPYVIWTMIQVKYDVYFFGSLPAFGVLIGAGLSTIRKRALRYALCAAALCWGIFHFMQLSFGLGPPPYAGCAPYAGDALRADGYPVWAHPAFPNNLERVARRFIGEIGVREAGNRYVRIGVCEFEYSARNYLLVDSFEYFMESANPEVYVYRSFFAPESFLECMDSFNYLVVLEEGEREHPDFRPLAAFFAGGYGASLRARHLGSADTFERLVGGYRGYELLDRELLHPEGVSAFLLRKPPFPVAYDAALPATHLVSANVFIAHPRIGVDNRLLREPTIGDYDVLFPYDLDFPLVPPARRDPSEPYFARYRLSFGEGGAYVVSVRLEDGDAAPPRAFFDGRPLEKAPAAAAHDELRPIGSFSAAAGEGVLDLVGGDAFPLVDRIGIARAGP
ncbi:MAG: glycosyltransferase family 39 protein [bacterium]|nr:glycosyltransferase family 39 protein [bacterium]